MLRLIKTTVLATTFTILTQFHIQANEIEFDIEELTSGLAGPWSIAVLGENKLLITEKSGQLRLFDNGEISGAIAGIPEVYFAGQGGLLDVKVKQLEGNKLDLFLSYADGTPEANGLAITRAVFDLDTLGISDAKRIFRATPDKDTPVHYGGRMAFLPDNTLVVVNGDGFDYREAAQKKDNLMGKVIRMNLDGSVPDDNPFVGQSEYNALVYSLGHRNPQALLFDAQRNWIVSHEHGPAGGDEINIIKSGNNYGWPVITNGKDYSGARISPFTEYEGMEQPFVDWTPSIAPSDMVVYRGAEFPELVGDYLVTTLKTQELRRVDMEGNQVSSQVNLLPDNKARYRAIQLDEQGHIYLATDDGRILKLSRKG